MTLFYPWVEANVPQQNGEQFFGSSPGTGVYPRKEKTCTYLQQH